MIITHKLHDPNRVFFYIKGLQNCGMYVLYFNSVRVAHQYYTPLLVKGAPNIIFIGKPLTRQVFFSIYYDI